MNVVCSFVAKFSSLVVWVLSCFDRVIFKGHLPISRPREFEKFVDYRLKMRRCDFLKTTAPQWSKRIVTYAKDYAEQQGRLFDYRQGQVDRPGRVCHRRVVHRQAGPGRLVCQTGGV